VIGVILAKHWLRQPNEQFTGADGFELVFRAIRDISTITNGFDHIAIGTDLDGFIDPITPCSNFAQTMDLVAAIQKEFPDHADQILFKNALRVLRDGWQGVSDSATNSLLGDA
jgi:microsomal dipeptidase-like Zn-dependent dipeptidase